MLPGRFRHRGARLCIGSIGAAMLAGVVVWAGGSKAHRFINGTRQTAKPFQVADLAGNPVEVRPGERRGCILMFFCMCPRCRTLAHELRRLPMFQRAKNIDVIGVLGADQDQAVKFLVHTKFPGTLLTDPLGTVREQYHVGRCPNIWLIDPGGSVRFFQPDAVDAKELSRILGSWRVAHGPRR
jgi:peroxiredoxin